MTFEEIEKNETIRAYIAKADESLQALGFTEHSFAHVCHVAEMAAYILETLGYPSTTSSWRRSRAICTTSAIWSTASSTRRAAPSWRSRS